MPVVLLVASFIVNCVPFAHPPPSPHHPTELQRLLVPEPVHLELGVADRDEARLQVDGLTLVQPVVALQRLGEHGLLVGGQVLGARLRGALLQLADRLQTLRVLRRRDDLLLVCEGQSDVFGEVLLVKT